MKKTSITILTIIFLISCSTTGDKNNARYHLYENYITDNELTPVDRIRTFKMLNWKSLDNRHLIISSFHKKHYLISLNSFCQDLDSAHTIALDQSMDNSLYAKFDSVIVSTQQHIKCRISTIHLLDQAQDKEVVNLRKKLRESDKSNH